MRSSWVQPSLSRDFALLSVSVLFVLVLISGWITYRTYEKHCERIATDLDKEAKRIDNAISTEMRNANYMLTSLGRQIIISPEHDYTKLAQSLKSFDNKNYIYSIFSWTDINKKMVISSNKGVLEEPVDISDRDFIQQAATDSWKIHIGKPIDGRVSGKWVIPVAMGITDYTGKFIGIISLSIDIEVFTEQIHNLVKRDGISFAIISKDLVTLAEVSENKNFISDNFPIYKLANINFDKNTSGLITKGSLIWGTGIYTYYHVSENFPYIVVMGYDANYSDETVRVMLWSRLLQIVGISVFFLLFLWIVRVRVINPVLDITTVIASIVRGEKFVPLPKNEPVEINGLAMQVRQVSKYIDETKRIENELRSKMFLLKKAKENAERNMRSKSEFLAFVAQEMRMPLNNIIGFSQVLKDQVYGAIENRKYRQYAADIFIISNQLIGKIQDILTYSKVESGYMDLQEKPLQVDGVVNAAIRQVTDKLQGSKIKIKVNLQDFLPRLLADEFRLQQIIINLLLVMIDRDVPDGVITLEARVISEYRDKQFFALLIGDSNSVLISNDILFTLASELFSTPAHNGNATTEGSELTDLRFELAKILVALHGGVLHSYSVDDNLYGYIAFFPASRLIFEDSPEA